MSPIVELVLMRLLDRRCPGAAYGGSSHRIPHALDPILVAGAIDARAVQRLADPNSTPFRGEWTHHLVECLCGTGFAYHAALEGAPVSTATISSAPRWRNSLEELDQYRVIAGSSVPEPRAANVLTEGWCRYFQVEKDSGLDRAIFDCRAVNECLQRPPPILLAEISEIVDIMSYFPSPATATADLRHFFYQISLRPVDRSLFTLRVGRSKNTWHLLRLPMGFSWAPWAAQGVASLLLLANQRYSVAFPRGDTSSPPPFAIFRDKCDNIIAFAMVWYDNVCVVANCTPVRDSIVSQVEANARFVGAVWKAPFMKLSTACEYLGISFMMKSGVCSWKHTTKNIERWRRDDPRNWPAKLSPATVAALCGRCVWDCMIRGRRIGHMSELLRYLAEITGRLSGPEEWHTLSISPTENARRSFERAFDEIIANCPTERQIPADSVPVLLASDASDAGLGWVRLGNYTGPLLWQSRRWDANESLLHINMKETIAAIEAVTAVAASMTPGTLLVLGVDNTTAEAWLRVGWCRDSRLAASLETMHDRLERGQVSFSVTHVASEDNGADALSRLLPINEEKCQRSATILEGRIRLGWRQRTGKRRRLDR